MLVSMISITEKAAQVSAATSAIQECPGSVKSGHTCLLQPETLFMNTAQMSRTEPELEYN